jgi:hypothetical protein
LPQDASTALEPGPHAWLEGRALDDATGVLADYASIQSHWLRVHGHAAASKLSESVTPRRAVVRRHLSRYIDAQLVR